MDTVMSLVGGMSITFLITVANYLRKVTYQRKVYFVLMVAERVEYVSIR